MHFVSVWWTMKTIDSNLDRCIASQICTKQKMKCDKLIMRRFDKLQHIQLQDFCFATLVNIYRAATDGCTTDGWTEFYMLLEPLRH